VKVAGGGQSLESVAEQIAVKQTKPPVQEPVAINQP